MSVHYKFKSALDYDTVTFDGLHISVGDLKTAISQQKRIGKTSDFDLQITNAQTKEVYVDDNTLIPKNTSLLVARVPLSQQPKKQWENSNNQSAVVKDVSVNKGLADLSRMEGSEQDKINAMICQSTFDYDPSNYQKLRGQNQRGVVPANYVCFKCQKRGHWIKDCPIANSSDPVEIRRSSGIPRSFMVPVDGPKAPGAMMTPSGTFAVPAVDHEAYLASENAGGADTPTNAPAAPEPTIPDELICSLCRDLLTDAVMIPCCGNSFCDECIRGALLESEDHECPDCREKEIAPTTLIPNRFLRNSVSSFRNQTGYSRRAPHRPSAPPVQPIPQPMEQPVQGQPPNAAGMVQGPPNDDRGDVERGGRDDSDGSAEDNVTVTVPPRAAHVTSGVNAPRPRHADMSNGARGHYGRSSRYGPGPRSQGMEGPNQMGRGDEQRASTPTIDERRDPMSTNAPYHRGPPHYMPGLPPPHYNAPFGRPPRYNEQYPAHDLYQPPPPGIKDSPNARSEDPLEAFNRMIREKEMRAKRREEERRRVHSGSRSASRSPRSPPARPPRSPRPRASRSPRPRASRSPRLRGSRSPRAIRSSRSPRPLRESRSPRPIRMSRSPRPVRMSRSPRPVRMSRSPRPVRMSRSPRPVRMSRSPRPVRMSRSPRPLPPPRSRSPRSPRPVRPRSRGSSRLRYSRSRSMSRGRLRRPSPSPRRRRSRERSLSLSRTPSPRRRVRSPLRYRSPLRSVVRTPPRSPRPTSPHRYAGVYDELLSPPRRPMEPPFGARYSGRENPTVFPPLGSKPVPLMNIAIPPQHGAPPNYRGRYEPPPFDDAPPGVDPPVPGFEPPPFEKPPFGPPVSIERERLNYRDPYRQPPFIDGPGFRNAPISVQNDMPLHGDHHQRYRDNFRPGASYRDPVGGPYRDAQHMMREQVPPLQHRDTNYRNGPPFRDNSFRNPPLIDGNFRENVPHNFRDGAVPFRPPSADPRDPMAVPFHDPNYRDALREENNGNRDGRSGFRSNSNRSRVSSQRHDRPRERNGRDRERFNDGRESERSDRPRGSEKVRDSRDHERNRDYDKERERGHEKTSPERKNRGSPKRSRDAREKKRSESRGRSRERESKREKKEERTRDKSSPERNKEPKDKDKKIKDRKKKKREKEVEKKKKRDKKEKKEKEVRKDENENDEGQSTNLDENTSKKELSEESKELIRTDASKMIFQEIGTTNAEEAKNDLYGDEAAEAVDKEIIQNYIKSKDDDADHVNTESERKDPDSKDEPFDGIELQPAVDELGVDLELPSSTTKEMLAPLPELSKWEVEEEHEKAKEPGEYTSPEEEEDTKKVTSEVIKRAEKAIFAKTINSMRPIEIKKISSDRLKLYGDDIHSKSSINNIQITVPVSNVDQKSLERPERRKSYSKTPPPRLSIKERLGGKVEDVRRVRESRVVHSTVELVKSRSKTPKKEQGPYRRVTVEKERNKKPDGRVDVSKDKPHDKRVKENIRMDELHKKKEKTRDEQKQSMSNKEELKNVKHLPMEVDRERKKSALDESHFEPDYDENIESDSEQKEVLAKKREHGGSPGPFDTKKLKLENETIKLDLTNVKKKPDTESESSSDSDASSSTSSSEDRKRKKKKKRSKKKKKRAASDSESDSGSSSDEHKKKKKKRKHKKKSTKKKKKSKHK
ncbi:E3 ubiquitin-protein ligase RBBP6 isoform X3 [Leptidea sinapis]|uniref:E3 ubiquitin-protein ligase RBBP6 isoform X3 n=1 Tax=Leptidea sinapis TaxID=189913 RepID=UPI0021C49E2C|nr:E3 ubiquitin-protein ligase RBBP6 isoform X3 [Leptidea sinapis]